MVRGPAVAPDSVVLTADEASGLSDRVYQVRCAAEDVATAIDEGAEGSELRTLCDALMKAAKASAGRRQRRAAFRCERHGQDTRSTIANDKTRDGSCVSMRRGQRVAGRFPPVVLDTQRYELRSG